MEFKCPTIIMGFKKLLLVFYILSIFGNLVGGRNLDSQSEDSETQSVDESIVKIGNSSEIEALSRDEIENETLNRDEIETEIQLRDIKANENSSNVEASSSPFCQQVKKCNFTSGS